VSTPGKDEPVTDWRHTVRLLGVAVLVGCTGILAGAMAQASQASDASGRTWQVESTANARGAEINVLSAVSCTAARACTAVGSHSANAASPSLTLAERWNGTKWQIQRTAMPKLAASANLYGVSCATATACTAVGTAFHRAGSIDVNLAAAWNGTSWRVQATPNPAHATDGTLYAVSCTSAKACTAVGDYNNKAGFVLAVVERWNGQAWRIQPIPRPAKRTWFFGVSCPAANACTAVGYQNTGSGDARPFAESWNGTRWHNQKVPLPSKAPGGALSAVSCTSPSACTATGTDFSVSHPTLAERWNGTRWRVQPTPSPPNYKLSFGEVALDGVSCTSATACTASGEYSPSGSAAYFIEAWNGKRWRLATTPVPADFSHGALLGGRRVVRRRTAAGNAGPGELSGAVPTR
jgi:hypothetical protein